MACLPKWLASAAHIFSEAKRKPQITEVLETLELRKKRQLKVPKHWQEEVVVLGEKKKKKTTFLCGPQVH